MAALNLNTHSAWHQYTPEQAADLCEKLRADNDYHLVLPIGLEEYVAVSRFMFTWGILRGLLWLPDTYEDRWCYHTQQAALSGLWEWASREWQGEPQGWHRHPGTGRRRPDGDSALEYISY